VDLLYRDIAFGGTEVGIAVGVESLSTFNKKVGKGLLTTEGDPWGLLGSSTVSVFAAMANRMMETRGATPADLAYASWKNHVNGAKNPYAQYKKVLSVEDILNSKAVVDPLTAFMCCPQSDGAAAVVLCSEEYYDKHVQKSYRPKVEIAASVIQASCAEDASFDPLELDAMISGAKSAYEKAGIGPEDLDVIELHDAFSSEELAVYEMLGLCPKGEGVAFAHSGAAEMGGRCPVNPSGGLLSMGHPLGASGVRVVGDIAKQLWGEASANQVEGAKVGMAQMMGGLLANIGTSPIAAIQILKK
jgi:benzoylsuccinyl-CoA thiolase BbsB subunit